ncbi:MAG: endolytic transglycosylase MltG [Burkholderiales bacterium]|nr:endolytic transglycosylase MltG [Burkholderiales bacterium]
MKRIVALLLAGVLATVACAGWLAWFAAQPLALRASPLEVTVAPGSSARSAARQIAAAGVPMQPWQFELLARALGQDGGFKAGTYLLESGITPRGLLDKLVRGEVALTEIVFVEGWTFRQMRAALAAHAHLKHETTEASATEVMARLGADGIAPEGRFFPDTYRFARGTSDLEVLRMAYRAMQGRLEAAWAARAEGLPLASPDEALILASIVEKETGRAEDRALIAAVFVNRLRAGIRLQSDPTVIYGIGERFDGNLRRRDLERDAPYNTYTRAGLPPTPIAMPGLASLQAVLNPAASDALYFVARGDGSSEFSRTLQEHNRAVTKYQRGGR